VLYNPLTTLGRALHLSLALPWPRLRADAHIPRQIPLTAQAYTRMTHARSRLYWLLSRIDSLALRWQQGRLPSPRLRQPTSPSAGPVLQSATAQAAPARMRDPSMPGWLSRIHLPSRQIASQVEHLLVQGEMRALAQAAPQADPQAGRPLHPLCRMLGITLPDYLAMPPRPLRVKPRPMKPRRPRAPVPNPPGTPDRPLPAYVRAAVRAWRPKFG